MATITAHDNSFGARTANEPEARTFQRANSKGPLAPLTANLPLWYCGDTSLQTKTVNVVGYAEKRRAGR